MIKFEETEHTDFFKLSVQKGTEIDGIYKCRLKICKSPTCQCGVINFDLFPESELKNKELLKDIPIRFGIEIFEERIYSDAENKILKDHKKFAKSFIKCFDADEWKDLRRLFLRYKTFITENLDPDLADPYFPMDEIEEYSAMVGYYEILPYAQVLKISIEDNEFILDDQYCVFPDCSCTDINLTFIPVEKKSSKVEDYSNVIFINYKDRKWKTKDSINKKMSKTSELRSALEEKYPDIYKILKKRHSTLRLLYKKFRKRKLSENKLSERKLSKNKPSVLKKVGRNDPCPCGSGKKYKKCCLSK